MMHFISMWKDLFIKNLVHFIVHELVKIYKLSIKIIIDRDSLFVAEFWEDFMHILRILQDMSTAYYSQTNGQIERLNNLLK